MGGKGNKGGKEIRRGGKGRKRGKGRQKKGGKGRKNGKGRQKKGEKGGKGGKEKEGKGNKRGGRHFGVKRGEEKGGENGLSSVMRLFNRPYWKRGGEKSSSGSAYVIKKGEKLRKRAEKPLKTAIKRHRAELRTPRCLRTTERASGVFPSFYNLRAAL